MEASLGETKSPPSMPVPPAWQLPWVNYDATDEESPIFIEMEVIFILSRGDSNAPTDVMPVDTMGAVTIYYITPLK